MLRAFAVLALLGVAAATNLTPDNWDAETAGKTAFIKFQAPWWGHCKKMKPDWDKLMDKFEGHATILVADVDCTAEGKPLCDTNGVQGFPTIKHGDVSDLQAYEGGRDFASLDKFASALKPSCSPKNIDICSDEDRATIETLQAMPLDELEAAIAEKNQELADAESNFKAEVGKLQAKYESLQEEKAAAIQAVKDSGLGMMKSVAAAAKAAATAHDEL